MLPESVESDQIIVTIRSHFEGLPGVAAVYLFGSAAGGIFTPESDIDIGVLYEYGREPDALAQLDEQQHLADLLSREVDLVTLNDAPPILRYQVLKNGRQIASFDEKTSNFFFVRTLNEYFDLKRSREVIEKSLHEIRII